MKRPTVASLEKLWSECVKARAGFKSEYSGKTDDLNSHHIHGKPSYRLRFELDNGVCITSGEHKFLAHHAGREDKFKEWACKLRNFDREKARRLSNNCGGNDLFLVQIYLKQKLKEFKSQCD